MSTKLLAVVLSLVAMCTSTLADAQSGTVIGFDDPVFVGYVVEYHPSMDDSDFESLARQVSARPEHPQRRAFEDEKRRRQAGPDRVKHEVWITRSGVVRANSSNTHNKLFTDYAVDGETLWMLSPAQLTLSSESVSTPDAPDIKAQIRDAEATIAYFLSEGRSISAAIPVGEWRDVNHEMVAEGEGIALRWSQDSSGKSIVTLVQADLAPHEAGRFWTLSGHAPADVLGMDLPRIFEESLPNGRLERRVLIEEIRASTHDEIDRVTKRPPLDGRDEVRGPVTYSAIMDHRSRDPEITMKDADGLRTVRLSQAADHRRQRTVRMIGWATAGVLVAAFVILRIRRSASLS